MLFISSEQNSLREKTTRRLYDDFDVVETVSFEAMYHV